jgi:hypothetical protein
MKEFAVVGLWALAGCYVGGGVERITGLATMFSVLAAFAVVGIYLGIRVMLATRSAKLSRVLRAADPGTPLTA